MTRRIISAINVSALGPQFADRFWHRVQRIAETECWPWLGYRKPNGYGQVYIARGRFVTASRVAYALTNNGIVPHGVVICHRCDNPPCCNPAHLFAGTQSDNALDSVSKGRANRVRGEHHPSARLNEEQVFKIRTATYRRGIVAELASLYGVSEGHINRIRAGRKWAHLDGSSAR